MIAKPFMSTSWSCIVLTNENTSGMNNTQIIKIDQTTYVRTDCEFNMKVINKTSASNNSHTVHLDKMTLVYICAGVVVFVIIATQTVIIIYFKAKARKMARLRRISQRASTVGSDKNQYIKSTAQSQQRGIKNWLNKRTNNRDDNDIYETLEEIRGDGDTPPVPPIETIPSFSRLNRQENAEVSTLPRPENNELLHRRVPTPDVTTLQRFPAGREKNVEIDISKRPPLPLPTETFEETNINTIEKSLRTPLVLPSGEKPTLASPQRSGPTVPPLKPSGIIPTPKGKPRHVPNSIVNELDHKLKLRKVSMSLGGPSPPGVVLPAPAPKPSKEWTASRLFGRKAPVVEPKPSPIVAPASSIQSKENQVFQLPEKPNPLPTGKSAVLLGLSPPLKKPVPPKPAPAPMPKPPPALPKPVRPVPAEKPPASVPPPAFMTKPLVPVPTPIQAAPAPAALTKPPAPPPIQEPLYEEYQEMDEPEEDIYNSDDEWCYEPLPQYNIYSS